MHQLIDKKNKITMYLLFLFILSTINGKFLENPKDYSSAINQINIEGLSEINNLKIFDELNNLFYKNIFIANKEEIQSVIDKYNIIDEYSIKKIYPSTININIKPTTLVARLSSNDQLVGANGKLIVDKENVDKLPYIFGKFIPKDFLKFKKHITESKFIFSELKTLYFFPSNRIDILTANDILIKLPNENFLESLSLAYKIINNYNFNNNKLIDLRIKNQLIVK